jgi:hypothetical protein
MRQADDASPLHVASARRRVCRAAYLCTEPVRIISFSWIPLLLVARQLPIVLAASNGDGFHAINSQAGGPEPGGTSSAGLSFVACHFWPRRYNTVKDANCWVCDTYQSTSSIASIARRPTMSLSYPPKRLERYDRSLLRPL